MQWGKVCKGAAWIELHLSIRRYSQTVLLSLLPAFGLDKEVRVCGSLMCVTTTPELHSSYKETRWFGSTIFSLLWIISLFLLLCTHGICWQQFVYIIRADTLEPWSAENNRSGLGFTKRTPKARFLISWRLPAAIIINAALFPQTWTDETNKIIFVNLTCKLAPSNPARDHLALAPQSSSNLGRSTVQTLPGCLWGTLLCWWQTAHAYRKGREECLWGDWLQVYLTAGEIQWNYKMKKFIDCKIFQISDQWDRYSLTSGSQEQTRAH